MKYSNLDRLRSVVRERDGIRHTFNCSSGRIMPHLLQSASKFWRKSS